MLDLDTEIDKVPLIGPAYANRLAKLNIFTVKHLLHHYPVRYLDLSQITTINQVRPNQTITLKGKIESCQNIFTKTGKKMQKAVISDNTGSIQAIWFNQTYLPKTLKSGLTVNLSGSTSWFNRSLSLISPAFEIIKDQTSCLHTGRLISVYPETKGLSSKWLRSRINFLLNNLKTELETDWLPKAIKQKHHLIDLNQALNQIHFPDKLSQIEPARKRLAFDEMLLLQLRAQFRKKTWQQQKLSHPLTITLSEINQLISSLPFKLTSSQQKAVKQILADLEKNTPMNRLLQGDVGSGKTVVAAIAAYTSFLNHYQSVLMAPTEILARQHFNTLKTVFKHTGLKLQLVTASVKTKALSADILIGTHALLHRRIDSDRLGLIVIDEQHRFGVKQRDQLIKKAKTTAHLLTMTATPIPRTIALTAYADLDVSTLTEIPQNRASVKTWLVPPQKRSSAYDWIKKQIKTHSSQAFIVCPLIEASSAETMKDIKNVTQEYDQLVNIFNSFKLDLLHGRLSAKDKQKALHKFSSGQTDILVTTPVIEVGIDIPNAAIMVIETAERFGLAQLHQLRGRVGRGTKESYCLLFSDSQNPQSTKRLQSLTTVHSGILLAELDMKLRGPGDLFGLAQHGFLDLKLASFTDADLVSSTKTVAQNLINTSTPALKKFLKTRTIQSYASTS